MNIIRRAALAAALLLATAFAASAQITVSVKDKDIRSVIQQIEKTTDYRFFYSSSLQDLDRKVSIVAKNEPVGKFLNRLFKGTDIKYVLKGDQISLTGSPAVSQEGGGVRSDEGQTAPPKHYILTGEVKDGDGQPLIGVNITIKGRSSSIGTSTDINGNFKFETLPDDAILEFDYVGFRHEEMKVSGRSSISLTMLEDSQVLDEVVVIGYGTLEKRELTSSVSSIKSKELIGGNVSTPLQAISGKVTGLDTYSSAGTDPNGSVSVQLRGINSVLADMGPLIVVDGIPGGNMNVLQKEDIVSIDVLKDASAAAIYGTRASGGVILVTTRRGKEGRTDISYSTELTTETIAKKADVLTADEWRTLGLTDYGGSTDWFDEITRTPFTQRHVLTMNGGSRNAQVYASVNYKKAMGMSIGSDRQDIGGLMNFNYLTDSGFLEMKGGINYVDTRSDYTTSGIFRDALYLNPTIPVYNPDDPSGYNILSGNSRSNPVAWINLREDYGNSTRMQANLSAVLHIAKGLTTTATGGYVGTFSNSGYWESALHRSSRDNNRKGYASQEWGRYQLESFEWVTNYNAIFGDHNLKAVAGYSFQQTGQGLTFSASNADFSIDGEKWFNMGEGKYLAEGRSSLSSYKSPRERVIAVFGRVNYSFRDKYLFAASIRREGSSKFGSNNKWGWFPSVSAAWRISSEPFMQNFSGWLNDLRIRAAYGRTGNQGFDPGVTTRMYKSDTDPYLINGVWTTVYGLAKNVNYNLQWETKDEYNIGMDFDMLGHRLSGKFDVYKRFVGNLIYDISVAQPPAVYPTTTENVGNLMNVGFEFELSGVPIQKQDMSYRVTLKGSHNETTLSSLWGNQTFYDTMSFPSPGSPGTAVRLQPGTKIGQFYIWKYAGIAEDGSWLLYDKDNNVIPASEKTQADKRYIGNAIPKLELSLDNQFTYKNFDLDIFFRSWLKYDVYCMMDMYYGLPNTVDQNMLRSQYEKNKNITGEKELCDYFLEDGSFLKLDAVSMGYTLPFKSSKAFIKSLHFTLTGRNLFCLTGYSGLDPEVDVTGLTPGFEGLYVYPRTRTYTLGIQVNF
jgi:TonB-linked SusC/RagA family outer membrane protein